MYIPWNTEGGETTGIEDDDGNENDKFWNDF